MADLLSPQDRDDIFAAFGDLDDTFFQYDAVFQIRARKLAPFRRTRGDGFSVNEVTVRCLPVPDKSDDDAENGRKLTGSVDFTEGVIYCFTTDLITAGLSSSTLINVVAGKDTVKVNTIEYDIIGVNQVAPLKDNAGNNFVLGKFQVKKRMKPNS